RISGIKAKLNGSIFRLHGRIGFAAQVNGKSGSINLGKQVGQFGTSDFTIAFGLNVLNTHDQRDLDIIGNRRVKGHGNWVSLRLVDKRTLNFEVDEDQNGKNFVQAKTDRVIIAKRWVHVALVRQGPSLKIYFDGVLHAENKSNTGVANIKNNVDFKLGHTIRHTPTARYEDLRIYDRALSGGEILNLVPPANALLLPGQVELIAVDQAAVTLREDEQDLLRYSGEFQRLRMGPNMGATLYRGANFTGTSQKLYADLPSMRLSRLGAFPRSIHIWSAVGEPFTGSWIIKAPNGQNLSRSVNTLTTSPKNSATELFRFHYLPNFERPLLIPVTNQHIALLKVGNESAVLVVDDSEAHEDAFSIRHPERSSWLKQNPDSSFRWTPERAERALFQRAVKLATHEGQVGELKAGEVALYEHFGYRGRAWIFSDNKLNAGGNFTSLRGFAGLDNIVSSLRVGPYTGVTLFTNENQVVNDAKRETEIEDFVEDVPSMAESQIGNDRLSSFKIFRTVGPDTIFTSVTSKLSQDYRLVNDELEEFSAYRSILRLAPEVTEIEVSATDLTTIEVEDTLYEIDEIRTVTLKPNLLNQIMITSEADGISTPGLKFRTPEMAENERVVIFPDQEVHQQIAALEDDALWNATDSQGNLIVDQSAHTRSEVANVQNTIKRTMATVVTVEEAEGPDSSVPALNGLGRVVSTNQVVSADVIDSPWTINFTPASSNIPDGMIGIVAPGDKIWEEPVEQSRFEALYAQATIAIEPSEADADTTAESTLNGRSASLRIGGFFRKIGDAVKDAVKVTIGVFDSALNAIIDLGGQIVRFVLDTAKKVADFVTAVVEKVVKAIKAFVEFLRFLFDWDDILAAQRFIVQTINNAFDAAGELVEAAKEPVSEFFDSLQEGLDDGVDSLARLLGVDPDAEQKPKSELPEAAEWFLNKVVFGLLGPGSKDLAIRDAAEEAASDFLENGISQVLEDLTGIEIPPMLRAILDIFEKLKESVKVGTKFRDEILSEVVEALITNPTQPEQILVGILDAIRTVSSELLETGEEVALTILDFIVEAINGLKNTLNAEIKIPLISALFELIGAGKLTLLNLTTILVAIPATIISKLLFNEAPFKNVSQPTFPTQTALAGRPAVPVLAGQSNVIEFAGVESEDEDSDGNLGLLIGFGVFALGADLINGAITGLLDLIPEPLEEFFDPALAVFEGISLGLSTISWLASFPDSPSRAGGYPYILQKVSKSQNEQAYWERVMWGWRTFVLSFDIVYFISAKISLPFRIQSKTLERLFETQRLRRGTEISAVVAVLFSLVDIGLTGRYLGTIPKDDKVGREISNEVLAILPFLFCWLRMKPSVETLLAQLAINVTSTVTTTGLNIAILVDDAKELA
ncbi:MAG: LamG domain-containing protein, partial [Chloroflexota bacterium]